MTFSFRVFNCYIPMGYRKVVAIRSCILAWSKDCRKPQLNVFTFIMMDAEFRFFTLVQLPLSTCHRFLAHGCEYDSFWFLGWGPWRPGTGVQLLGVWVLVWFGHRKRKKRLPKQEVSPSMVTRFGGVSWDFGVSYPNSIVESGMGGRLFGSMQFCYGRV